MAKFEFNLGDESILSETIFDDICKEALNECKNVLKSSMQNALNSVSDGSLASKVRVKSPKKTKTDAYILNASLSGNVKSGWDKSEEMDASSAAFWLEFGRGGKYPEPARPWVDKANNMAESECLRIIEKTHDKKLKDYEL